MPKAAAPEQMQVSVLFRENEEGERPTVHATSFIVLYIDQFGTPCAAAEAYEPLLRFLSPDTAEQVRRRAW